jgi:hypothetical protein
MEIVDFVEMLRDSVEEKLNQCRGYMHESHNPVYNDNLVVEIQALVYHGQFGFGEPITDIVLKNISGKTIGLGGPHSVAISSHEFYTPTTQSLEQIQHQQK